MREYPIHPDADVEVFENKCLELEKKIPNIKRIKRLIDVDETIIQIYGADNQKIVIYNDEETGTIYAKSEIDLAPYLD